MKESEISKILYVLNPDARIDYGPFGNRFVDITGQRYNRLIALIPTMPRHHKGGVLWLCQCDCGNYCLVIAKRLRASHTKSCGCARRDAMRKVAIHTGRTLPLGTAAFNGLLSSYKIHARTRDLEWDLTKDQFRKLTQMPCWYCQMEPAQIITTPDSTGDYIYNGIDRVDNSRGYMPENVVPCCKICNRAKRGMDYDEFLAWIARLRREGRMMWKIDLLGTLED